MTTTNLHPDNDTSDISGISKEERKAIMTYITLAISGLIVGGIFVYAIYEFIKYTF